jgi:peptidoglycan/LPS O-acetylase OafA/YrhL
VAQRQLSPLTGLRGIAAYAVLTAHALDSSFIYGSVQPFHAPASRLAYFGMSLFFVLSGFVIQHNYGVLFAKEPFGRALYQFFVARFARLYPLYIITLIPALAYLPSPYFTDEWYAGLAYLTLTQSWFNVQMATFAPDWSISTEWFFYFAFVPLTLIVVRRPALALIVASAAGVVALIVMFTHYQASAIALVEQCCVHDTKVSSSAFGWLIYFSPLTRLPEFILGMLAAKTYAAMSERPHNRLVGSIVITICLAWCVSTIVFSKISANPVIALLVPNFIFAPALALLMLNCCLNDDGLLNRILSARPLMFAGEISYSVYIWSWSALTLLGSAFISPEASRLAYANSAVKMVAILGYATVFAYGSYLLIEAPSRAYLRNKLAPRKPVAATAAQLRPAVAAMPPARPVLARMLDRFKIDAKWRSSDALYPHRFLRRSVDHAENQRREWAARDRSQALGATGQSNLRS